MLLEKRNYYKPFKYPFAYEAYLIQNKMHWIPQEIKLDEDIRDYNKKLTKDEQSLVSSIFRFFTQADADVAGAYAEHYLPMFPHPELRMMLGSFVNMEAIHKDAYSMLIDTLGFNESEYKKFLDIKVMYDKHEYLLKFNTDSILEKAKTMAVFSGFVEGIQLFSSFIMLLNFDRFSLMKGMNQIVTFSIRDETLHVQAMSQLFKQYVSEYVPQEMYKRLKTEIYQACERVVELENNFIDYCFDHCKIRGLSAEDVKNYIRYIADRRLLGLGLDSLFHVRENPLPWVSEILNNVEHANFFETRATEYGKANTTGAWGDVF